MANPVVIVMLRQPKKSDPEESRSDPFYEFGCFGATGCHEGNLLHDTAANGARLAFVQGGKGETRLVFVTPPVKVELGRTGFVARWAPAEMPLRFEDAPVLVENRPMVRNTALLEFVEDTNRSTPVGKFSSRFRSRKEPLPPQIADEILSIWDSSARNAARSASYVEALPYPPNRPLNARDRRERFQELMGRTASKPPCEPKPPGPCPGKPRSRC